MKKLGIIFVFVLGGFLGAHATSAALNNVLPLLQKRQRTAAENQQVLQLFRSANQPDVIFAAGASLVKIPPAKTQEPALFSILLRQDNGLKQIFSAVIITAMGSVHEELSPILEQGLSSQDPALRAYTAAAYALIHPENTSYTSEIVRLYIFDPAFAQRALNVLTGKEKSPFKVLTQAASSPDAQIRAAAASWLGSLHTQQAAKQLLKMAKKETDPSVQTAIATGLATNRDYTLSPLTRGLRQKPATAYANTCALSLGFMPGYAVDSLRQNLTGTHPNARINAARAAAYMAGVLSNPDAFSYSSDRAFDTYLLKGLIAPLKALSLSGSAEEKTYAENAMRQIEKLME